MNSEAAPMSRTDRLITATGAAAVLTVAGIAAVISYTHIRHLAAGHGGPGMAPDLLPLSVDGLILAASVLLLQAARAGRPAPRLAWAALMLGIVATLAANIAYGAAYGLAGAIIWSWPAAAMIVATELLMILIRRGRLYLVPESGVPATGNGSGPVAPEVVALFAEDLAAGQLPAIRRIRRELHCGQPRAQQVQAHLNALIRTS